jgi:hypothetical protein
VTQLLIPLAYLLLYGVNRLVGLLKSGYQISHEGQKRAFVILDVEETG